jgi:hypothetical protein
MAQGGVRRLFFAGHGALHFVQETTVLPVANRTNVRDTVEVEHLFIS